MASQAFSSEGLREASMGEHSFVIDCARDWRGLG